MTDPPGLLVGGLPQTPQSIAEQWLRTLAGAVKRDSIKYAGGIIQNELFVFHNSHRVSER